MPILFRETVSFGRNRICKPPSQIAMQHLPRVDKRRFLRYEILDYVLIRDTAELAASGNPDSTQAVIVDIGLGGLQVRTRDKLSTEKTYRVEVGRSGMEPLQLRCEVRHCEQAPDSDLFTSGLRFIPEGHSDRMAIATYVHHVFQRQCDMLTQ